MQENVVCLGIDLGGTAIKSGLCTIRGEIIQEFIRPTEATAAQQIILQDLKNSALEALEFAKKKHYVVQAIGIGTPGSVDVMNGFLKGGTPNFRYWKNVPIKSELELALALPVFVDNDANVMIYGEYMFGAGKGYKNVVGITLGTGIGGGVILDGEIFRGSNFAGAELGHMSIMYNGKPCRCGGIGCWEVYASATAMIDNYNKMQPAQPVQSTKEIFERYLNGEFHAESVVVEEILLVAVGVSNLLNIFNPEVFIIGGGVSEAGDWFVEEIAQITNSRAMAPATENVQIVRAKLGNSAGWMGAGIFAYHQVQKFID